MKWRYTLHCLASLGDLWLASGDPGRARTHADRCLELASRTGSRKYEVRARRVRGACAAAAGRRDEAESELGSALALAQALGNPVQLWTTQIAVGRLHAAAGRPELASASGQAAVEAIERVRRSLQDPALLASLDRDPRLREALALARHG